jgi:hypothetical protein
MSNQTGFDTALDYSCPDDLSEAERERLFRWYGETHGADASDLSLVPFVPFLAEQRPGALKRWRRFAEAAGSGEASLPQYMVALLFLHLYIVLCNEEGIRYELIAARTWGASREQVVDTINFGFLNAGPFGMNVVARAGNDLLANWDSATSDETSTTWTGAETVGDNRSPKHGELLTRSYPRAGSWLQHDAVAAHRDRVAHAFVRLPPQAGPLFLIHLGTARANVAICDVATREARRLNTSSEMFGEAAIWGLAYGGDVGLELAAKAIDALAS